MADRRYDDDETAEIFRIAAEGVPTPHRQTSQDVGLTLNDLQAIGAEVGISPDAVARAAVALETRGVASPRTLLGLPVGVSRIVELHRRMTDDEWERLVVRLRDVFHARGTTRSDGSLRQWTNGNLHVLLEPTDTGHRLRFGTVHSGGYASIRIGMMTLGVAAATAFVIAISGNLNLLHALPSVGFMGILGAGLLANAAIRLPTWARLRGRQMESLAAQVALPPGPSE